MRYLIRNLITDEVFCFKDLEEATQKAIAENHKNKEHPSFYLYDLFKVCEDGRLIPSARLHRDFGKEELFWKPISTLE